MIQTFIALAEPNRLRIVDFLRAGPKPVGMIADALDFNQPQTSKHLAVLKAARLVDVERRAQQRVYGLCPEGLRDLTLWVERYRSVWDRRFAQLDDVIEDLTQEGEHRRER